MVSPEEKEIITAQIGRDPRGLLEISFRCGYGYPAVIKTRPLLRGDDDFQIFPTLFWLTCPYRVENISRIESEGLISELEDRLHESEKLRNKYFKQQEEYVKERNGLLSREEEEFLERNDLEGTLRKGIGGIEERWHVKCLHMQLAHQLARKNVLGRILQKEYELGDCPSDRVICSTLTGES